MSGLAASCRAASGMWEARAGGFGRSMASRGMSSTVELTPSSEFLHSRTRQFWSCPFKSFKTLRFHDEKVT